MDGPTPHTDYKGLADRRSVVVDRLPWIAFLLLCAGLLTFFVVYPTYPNYDSLYTLLWARELWNGHKPIFDAFRAPTEHPLSILFSLVLAPLGRGADRVMLFGSLVSMGALAVGMYHLGRAALNRWVGLTAALLVVTKWSVLYLAVRGYLDVTYMALVVWAAVLETRRPHRGWPVMALFLLSGLLRPEAWILCGVYGLWMATEGGLREVLTRRGVLWLAAGTLATVVWVATDYWVTGHPLFSLTYTSGQADELGRTRSAISMPFVTIGYLRGLAGQALFLSGVAGLVAAIVIVPRRMAIPLGLFGVGIGTFLLLGVGGFSVIDRYLLVSSVLLLLFAAFLLAGWSTLPAGRLRRWWSRLAACAATVGVVVIVLHTHFGSIDNDLTFRGQSHADLVRVLDEPRVRAALRCGPVWTPDHKLVPDVRWILDAPVTKVLARSMLTPALFDGSADDASPDRAAARREVPQAATDPIPSPPRGLLVAPTSRVALLRQGYVFVSQERAFDAIPPVGFKRIATSEHYAVYASC